MTSYRFRVKASNLDKVTSSIVSVIIDGTTIKAGLTLGKDVK